MQRDLRVDRYLADMDKAHKEPGHKPTLPVVFRKHYIASARSANGKGYWEVTAYFPTLPSDSSSWYNMTCYAHIGQHSGASSMYYQQGKKAKPEEYADLLAEIRQIYEGDDDFPMTLKIYQRAASWMRDAREADWRRTRG